MKQWQKDGKCLILCVDANKNVYWGELGWQLTDLDDLGIKDVVREFMARQLRASYFQRSEPFDGIWAISNDSGECLHDASWIWSWQSPTFCY